MPYTDQAVPRTAAMSADSSLPLSPAVRALIERIFAARSRPEAERILVQECAGNLPLSAARTPEELDRVRCAALKLSRGRLAKLQDAARLAQVDWRDLLMAAGFGGSTTAHLEWQRQILG